MKENNKKKTSTTPANKRRQQQQWRTLSRKNMAGFSLFFFFFCVVAISFPGAWLRTDKKKEEGIFFSFYRWLVSIFHDWRMGWDKNCVCFLQDPQRGEFPD